jgi:type IV secretory pathway TraG/TraD family ATPase VirD4
MTTTPHVGKAGVLPVVASSVRKLINKSDNERSGVLSTTMSFLGLYRDPVAANVTRRYSHIDHGGQISETCDLRVIPSSRPTTR